MLCIPVSLYSVPPVRYTSVEKLYTTVYKCNLYTLFSGAVSVLEGKYLEYSLHTQSQSHVSIPDPIGIAHIFSYQVSSGEQDSASFLSGFQSSLRLPAPYHSSSQNEY